ncbi:putative inositol transporter 2, partial [Trichinella spiralis]|uniref:putative inositol transporter 2 n=1 Tax=Trichinella spiralis TaxID=6334 RepID=UPI0001EFD085
CLIVQMGGVRSRTMGIWMAAVDSGFNFFCTFLEYISLKELDAEKSYLEVP